MKNVPFDAGIAKTKPADFGGFSRQRSPNPISKLRRPQLRIISDNIMPENIYTNGRYFENNPNWHAEAYPWKAHKIINILTRNNIELKTICEIGCGTGENTQFIKTANARILFIL